MEEDAEKEVRPTSALNVFQCALCLCWTHFHQKAKINCNKACSPLQHEDGRKPHSTDVLFTFMQSYTTREEKNYSCMTGEIIPPHRHRGWE